jgi:CheY-like chemotaxis protein
MPLSMFVPIFVKENPPCLLWLPQAPFSLLSGTGPAFCNFMTESGEAVARRILLVDDDKLAREAIKLLLGIDRHTVIEAKDGEEALYLFTGELFDLVITDFLMPGMKGDELALNIKTIEPDQPVLMLTAFNATLAGTLQLADSIIGKPTHLDALRGAVAECFAQVPSTPAQRSGWRAGSPATELLSRPARFTLANETLIRTIAPEEDTRFRHWGIND